MFGCDICQDVCPWNRFSKPTGEPAFTPIAEILHYNEKDWEELTEEGFKKIFSGLTTETGKVPGNTQEFAVSQKGMMDERMMADG